MSHEDIHEAERLRKELIGLFQYIQRVRKEIANISRPADEDYHFETMSEQLDAVVQATDEASNSIMSAVETNEEIVGRLRAMITDPEQTKLLDELSTNDMGILEACAFQDLTGQRVNKVAKSVTYVEARVNALVEVWGREELEDVEVDTVEKTEDEKLLHGPQDADKAISQAEIDALFD